uniref:TPX2 domain-containing protein n=1 Tax=Angiostrongylus cantonensis TaxID=6313 RepID=A0A0K0DHX3_ANGCA
LGETLSSASDWLHEEKAKARELIRKIARAGAVRKTPHHGKPFASIRNTAENYRNSIFSIGIHVSVGLRHAFSRNDVETKSGDSDVSSTRGAIHVKEEVFSISRPTTTSTASDAVSEADRRVTKDRPVKSGRLRQRQLLSTVAEVQKGMNKRVAAGLSQTRLRRAVRQHGVTTPCKREYKEAVQRVVIEQDLMRNSANRGLVPTPTRLDHGVPNVPVAALSHPRTPHPNPKIALRREKEELAAQLREEQCRERAERVRKEREEKALRVQRRRQQREIEERLKAEARKQKEIRDERRREELRQQKSPARCKATSEFVSPARAAGVNANAKVHVGSKVLFPCTPGRSSAKLAKMLFSPGGGPRREPTMITPSREAKRKQCLEKKMCTSSEDSIGSACVSFSIFRLVAFP